MKDKLRQGETLFADGKIEEAEKCFLNILAQDSQNKEALNNLGVIAFKGQKIENAIDYFDKSLQLDPFYKEAVLNYAYLLKELDLLYEVSSYLYKIIEKYPNDKELKQILNEIEISQKPRKKLAILCLPGLESFLGDIVAFFQTKYEVQICFNNNSKDIEAAVNWADILWLEWANQMAIHVTKKLPQIKDKKVICRLHGYEVFTDLPAHIDWSLVDHLIFVAKHKQDIFNKKFNVQSLPQQTVIRNGVNTDKFTIAAQKRNMKRLVLLGHINPRKGIPILLQFYNELLKHDPEYYLYIRGDFQDQRLEMAVRTMIKELSLSNKLEFVGWVDDLNDWLADKSHILSFSLEESFHYAIGNGMAAGLKPVIHAWKESRDIWPEDFIFNDLDSFIDIMLNESYEPHNYRQILFDQSLDYKNQILEIEELLKTHVETKTTLIQEPGFAANINNQPEIHDKKPINKNKDFSNNKKNIYIIGLRRSGTTIFWNTIRQDKRFVCFDEPFRPHLRGFVERGVNDKKKTMDEYLARPELIKKYWSSIQPYEETYPDFLDHQVGYLNELIKTSPNICVDFVRCHAKIQHLKEIDPEGFIIHLVRDPRAFVTSHLKPYGKWISPDLPDNFFNYDGWFDYWQYQTLANNLGLKGKAFEKLLQLWEHFFLIAENQKPHLTIKFEDFATSPEEVIEGIYTKINICYKPLEYSKVHPPNPPYEHKNIVWDEALIKHKIDSDYLYKNF